MHHCMGWTGSFVPAHSSETSADKHVDLPPIHPPHLHLRVRSVLDFALLGKLVRPEYALYAVSVRRAGSLLRTSFRFHLTMDTLVFRLQFLLTSLYRTFTDESTHMPRIPEKSQLAVFWQAEIFFDRPVRSVSRGIRRPASAIPASDASVSAPGPCSAPIPGPRHHSGTSPDNAVHYTLPARSAAVRFRPGSTP